MKLSDRSTVEKLIKSRDSIKAAIKQSEILGSEMLDERPDPGGIEGLLERGYFCNVSKHSDGSGRSIKLTGCYVGIEVVYATHDVLKNKLKEVDAALEQYGVTVDTQ